MKIIDWSNLTLSMLGKKNHQMWLLKKTTKKNSKCFQKIGFDISFKMSPKNLHEMSTIDWEKEDKIISLSSAELVPLRLSPLVMWRNGI